MMLPEAGTLILQGQKSARANVAFRSPLTDLVAYRRGNERTGKELFEEKGRTVFMPASIWTELALLGRWVQDSVVIRWAEFAASLKHQPTENSAGRIMSLLLTVHDDEREAAVAPAGHRAQARDRRKVGHAL